MPQAQAQAKLDDSGLVLKLQGKKGQGLGFFLSSTQNLSFETLD